MLHLRSHSFEHHIYSIIHKENPLLDSLIAKCGMSVGKRHFKFKLSSYEARKNVWFQFLFLEIMQKVNCVNEVALVLMRKNTHVCQNRWTECITFKEISTITYSLWHAVCFIYSNMIAARYETYINYTNYYRHHHHHHRRESKHFDAKI